MPIIEAKCTQCGAALRMDSNENDATCEYCGTPFLRKEPVIMPPASVEKTKFCKYCAGVIPYEAIICTKCGRQVEKIIEQRNDSPVVVHLNSPVNTPVINPVQNPIYNQIPHTYQNQNTYNAKGTRPREKVAAILLCLFLGVFGAHKFYENKIGMGVLYIFTWGLLGIGIFVDLIVLITKPKIYYV